MKYPTLVHLQLITFPPTSCFPPFSPLYMCGFLMVLKIHLQEQNNTFLGIFGPNRSCCCCCCYGETRHICTADCPRAKCEVTVIKSDKYLILKATGATCVGKTCGMGMARQRLVKNAKALFGKRRSEARGRKSQFLPHICTFTAIRKQ